MWQPDFKFTLAVIVTDITTISENLQTQILIMKKIIVVAGATGNLGGKIVNALLNRDAEVRAINLLAGKYHKASAKGQKN